MQAKTDSYLVDLQEHLNALSAAANAYHNATNIDTNGPLIKFLHKIKVNQKKPDGSTTKKTVYDVWKEYQKKQEQKLAEYGLRGGGRGGVPAAGLAWGRWPRPETRYGGTTQQRLSSFWRPQCCPLFRSNVRHYYITQEKSRQADYGKNSGGMGRFPNLLPEPHISTPVLCQVRNDKRTFVKGEFTKRFGKLHFYSGCPFGYGN